MSRISVPYDKYFSQLCQSLGSGGALLVGVDENDRPNPMTIGWAQVGIIWGKQVCTVLVRPSRYTYDCCNAAGDFTVNAPYASQADEVLFCGTKSGRDYDKFAECGFTAVPSVCEDIASPYIAECGLVYECKTLLHNEVIPANLSAEVTESFYAEGDFHRVYFGEILACHVASDFEERFAAE